MSNSGTTNRAERWVELQKGKTNGKKNERIQDKRWKVDNIIKATVPSCSLWWWWWWYHRLVSGWRVTSIHSHRIIKHPHGRSSSTPLSDYTLRLITRWSSAFPVLFTLLAAPAPAGRLPVIIWVDARPHRMSFFNCIVSRWRDESTSPRYRHNSGAAQIRQVYFLFILVVSQLFVDSMGERKLLWWYMIFHVSSVWFDCLSAL